MSTTTTRCAGCKYLRRRCPSTCILSPYFPPNDPQRFAYVHKIYGASNVTKMLQQVPVNQRGEVADSLYYEAYCRIKDPVYGCVGIITQLHQQIHNAQSELAKIEAEFAIMNSNGLRESKSEQVFVTPIAGFEDANYLEGNMNSFTEFDPSVSEFY